MPKPPKRPAHRPPWAPTDKERLLVKIMVAGGIEQANIATGLGITPATLRKHCRAEIKSGSIEINALVIGEHIKRIRAGDFKAIQWWEQSRMGWSEIQKVETTGKDGRPIEQVVTYRWAEPPK